MSTESFSKETQALLAAKLPWWLRWGNWMVVLFIGLVLCLLLVIKVPQKKYYPVYYYVFSGREVMLVQFPKDHLPDSGQQYKLITGSKYDNIALSTGPFQKHENPEGYIDDLPQKLVTPALKNGELLGELEVVDHDCSLLSWFFDTVF